MFKNVLFVAMTSATFLFGSPALAADDAPPTPMMTLTGVGHVTAPPDIAIVSIGVAQTGKTAREALDANNAAMAEILKKLREQGVADTDLQTSGFSVQPQYSQQQGKLRPEIIGYQMFNHLTVTIRDLEKAGSIVDLAVSTGSNQINQFSYSIDDPEPLRDQARVKATEDALRKASIYAKAANFELGPILSISEVGGPRPPVYRQIRAQAAEAASGAVPLAEGEQSIRVSVNVTWEIRQ